MFTSRIHFSNKNQIEQIRKNPTPFNLPTKLPANSV